MKRAFCDVFRRLVALAILAEVLMFPGFAHAEGAQAALRVGFAQAKGFSETAQDGSCRGLIVDYLNEIAKYTGWTYEYIEVSGEALLDAFFAGEFDLTGGTYYLPGYEDAIAYPDYDCGQSKSVLLARRDDRSIVGMGAHSVDGKVIGVYENAKENVRRLQEFLNMNGVNCTLRYYTREQMQDGNLFSYLKSGEVDLLLGNNSDDHEDFRVVASFNAQPHYIVTTPGNQAILDGLNRALKNIWESDPNFAEEVYARHFPNSHAADVILNEEEEAYIRRKGSVTVAVATGWHPLYCLDQAQPQHDGVAPDVLKEISAVTGLGFTFVQTQSYADALRMVRQGQADLAGFFLDGEEAAQRQGLSLTKPYATLNDIVARNKSVSFPGEQLTAAVIEARNLPAGLKAQQIRDYPDVTEALAAVNRGEVDLFYGLSGRIEQEIQAHYFSNVIPVGQYSNAVEVAFALPKPAEAELLTILNKAINSLSDTDKREILNRNLISSGTAKVTLAGLIYSNPIQAVIVISATLLLILVAVLLIARFRVRAVQMRAELERAEADSRAKSAFLSRMSHEIRTPMNAVIGLADLTGMLEDVPEQVKDNLTKIRSSSRYLLGLINDILDMSRVENGMMTIAKEPFDLPDILADIESMMAVDAKRRGLAFTVETSVSHRVLSGDAIRLRQVLTNLISNAFKFTPPGGSVVLQALERSADEQRCEIYFRVQDDGVGIRPEDQARIFDVFEQLGTSRSQSQGTGLGLPISSSIVRLMGGTLELESEPGRGSAFYFTITLPLAALPEPAHAQEAGCDLNDVCLLLAEDNDLNAEIAVQLLTRQGARVVRAEDGRRALEMFETSAPGTYQAVLMDIQMPRMNGLEATRAIRALPRPDAEQIPIVAMTANSFQEDIDAANAAGMNAFIAKPIDVHHLYRVLRDLIAKDGR